VEHLKVGYAVAQSEAGNRTPVEVEDAAAEISVKDELAAGHAPGVEVSGA